MNAADREDKRLREEVIDNMVKDVLVKAWYGFGPIEFTVHQAKEWIRGEKKVPPDNKTLSWSIRRLGVEVVRKTGNNVTLYQLENLENKSTRTCPCCGQQMPSRSKKSDGQQED